MSRVKNLAELQAARAPAGARYAAAIAELRSALVDLEAIDQALICKNVSVLERNPLYRFRELPRTLAGLEHPEFAPLLRTSLREEIGAATRAYVEGLTS
ncbi:hypothetical protein [Methylocystis sp.]|uniref:hypothetical protein n=1 Tax=Methylocystis sp. TaxID=1911079 RepID=UPI002733396D|nr:hypothetical protein [Methylocystis sp.]MDP3553087.1 hypothetical protein [Methylocystis sp.]